MDIITAIFIGIIALLAGVLVWFVYDDLRQSRGYRRLAELDRDYWDSILGDDDDYTH